MKYSNDGGNSFTTYYYVLNLQGDVVMLLDQDGNVVAEYAYTAWGQLRSASGRMAFTNPLRYRGYYYDSETGFYYLQSRYYDPALHRFINADGYTSTDITDPIASNMFAYCGNNPINRSDPSGHFWKELWEAFTQSLQQSSGTFALAGGITQLDSPLPGPADVVAGAIALTTVLDCAVVAIHDTISTSEEEKMAAIEATHLQAYYYGCRVSNSKLEMLTPPMTFDEACTWANSSARLNDFGKNAKWGIYTNKQSDAQTLAFALGSYAEPVFDFAPPGSRIYNHYHVNGRVFLGYFKHFHIWYGTPA